MQFVRKPEMTTCGECVNWKRIQRDFDIGKGGDIRLPYGICFRFAFEKTLAALPVCFLKPGDISRDNKA